MSSHFLPNFSDEETFQEEKRPTVSRKRSDTIDGFILLEACGVEFPDDGLTADVSGYDASFVADFQYFPRLLSVDASENRLTPSDFSPLVKLRELKLSANGIRFVCGEKLRNLLVLDLSYNYLEDISQLPEVTPQLRELDLTCNGLSSFHSFLPRLEKLILDRNKFTEVGNTVGNLPKLRDLRLAHNSIEKFYGKFYMLETLCLAHNSLSDISALSTLPKLEFLSVYGNPMLKTDSDEFIAQTLKRRDTDTKIDVALKPPSMKCGTFGKSVALATVRDNQGVPSAQHFKEKGRRLLSLEEEEEEEEESSPSTTNKGILIPRFDEDSSSYCLEEEKYCVAPPLLVSTQPTHSTGNHRARCSSLKALKFVLDHPLTTHDTRYPPSRGGPVPFAARPTKSSVKHRVIRKS